MTGKLAARATIGTLLVVWGLYGTCAEAVGESSARASGMGLAYTAVSRNLDAVGWNPANLGLSSDRKVSIALFSAGAGVGNTAYSLGDYETYNGMAFWDEATKREILSKIPAEGLAFNTAAEARALGISYGRTAFRINLFGSARGRLPKDPVELMLFGNQADRTYRIDSTDGKGQAAWNLSLSRAFALSIEGVETAAVGVTVRYLRGIGYFEVQNGRGTLVTHDRGIRLDGSSLARRAEGGNGLSVDLGFGAELDGKWTVGVALIHLGRIWWNKDAREHRGSMQTDSLKVEDLADVEEFDDLFNTVDDERILSSFGGGLPATFRLGVARRGSRWLLAADWEQGLSNAPGSTTRPRIALGSEYLVTGWLPVRAGISLGGRTKTTFSAGLGLGGKRIVFDLAIRVRKGVVPRSASGVGVAAELKLGF
ncbi:MAG: DUF5723 family protein [Candidatus Latescibacteria bacterium]|jgi:hypothetical protein|nr:DUF5723 family protein [Candidatus Latescibacterota bacterium]